MASLLTELFSDLGAVFDRTSVRWYVFGAQAAIIHGAARLTADVDITVMLGNHPIKNLIQVLKEKGFEVCVSDVLTFVEHSRVLLVFHSKSSIPVDIVLGSPGLEEQFMHRAQQYDMAGVMVPISSSEDPGWTWKRSG